MIGIAMEQTYRRSVEKMYTGVCSVYVLRPYDDPESGITRTKEVRIQNDLPCRLSFSNLSTAEAIHPVTAREQKVTLFLAPEKDIPPGSKIVVTQCGGTTEYTRSGKSAVYSSHQEVPLKLFEGWA